MRMGANLSQVTQVSITRLLSVLLCLIVSAAAPPAAEPYIRFVNGQARAAVSGRLSGSKAVCYRLRARSGQHMKVSVAADGPISGEVASPSGTREGQPGDHFYDSDLHESGDYRVCLYESPRAEYWRGGFTMTVELK
jgi:hypothetical protein